MSYVHDNPGGTEAHGVDLLDGDEPAVRILVHGDLPTTIEHEGRTWLATGQGHDAGEDGTPPIAIYRPV
ncbi:MULTISPECIES: hypothetical protein [unclassified Curtobacterium]|uniref:hypothetical protein n=1 Tax=unclassified Curtobacterium TaxID=257496 RepID=UPI0008DCF45E|nr:MULTISPECIES: hypothetical protein [unclassified Curtobacterium]OIH98578.1 hypothetical protein BIU92_12600 [Curtobacterium sp. MCBA15_003]OII12751.1 hypothetical protein BIU97_01970 [Curtobacterium sp. MCBA15_009]OII32303.1 hypothetical protein BIU94_02930 [Curtobacterium sp. MMLR14_006]WIE63351.1 hypothetical protein DEI99_008685 [Curtobacterium sp. MCLR17_036]